MSGIDWDQYDRDLAAERAKREGFRTEGYSGEKCANCGRNRVMFCKNGKRVCEKCGRDQVAGEYSEMEVI